MALPERIPVFLLSGFLGSGKSTLLNEVLKDPAFADTAVIINEFGDVPVDHLLLRKGETAISQVSTGCLCCSGSTDLRETLYDVHCAASDGLCQPFSRVIVEMSGLGDPAPLVNALMADTGEPETPRDRTIDQVFRLAGFVTLYDTINGAMSLERHFEALKQVAFADRLVLTKTDLAQDPATLADIAALPAELSLINAGADVIDGREADRTELFKPRAYMSADRGEDVAGWLALEAALAAERSGQNELEHRNVGAMRHGAGIRTFSIVRDEPVPMKRFGRFLSVLQNAAGPRLLRVKGIVAVAEDPEHPRIVHAVQHVTADPVILDAWPDDDRRTRLVFITNDIDPKPVHQLFDAAIEGSTGTLVSLPAQLGKFLLSPVLYVFGQLAHVLRRSK